MVVVTTRPPSAVALRADPDLSVPDAAIGDHIGILVAALIALALGIATVGSIGLGAATATQIVERTREIGVMRAIGATPRSVVGIFLGEGLVVGSASALAGIVFAIAMTSVLTGFLGRMAFASPPPLVISPSAIAAWWTLILALSAVASGLPAFRATRGSVRESLAAT